MVSERSRPWPSNNLKYRWNNTYFELLNPHPRWKNRPVASPLEALFGNRTAAKLMLYLFHYGEAYPTGAARDLGLSLSPVQRQLEKFEAAGILVSRLVGRTRLYSFNPKHPARGALRDLIQVFYEGMPLSERQRMFQARRRHRRRGKPVGGK